MRLLKQSDDLPQEKSALENTKLKSHNLFDQLYTEQTIINHRIRREFCRNIYVNN